MSQQTYEELGEFYRKQAAELDAEHERARKRLVWSERVFVVLFGICLILFLTIVLGGLPQ